MAEWEQGDKLGFGRFGVVFACRRESDPEGDWIYAIKGLQKDLAASEEVVERFAREVRILGHLDHENVMPVLDSGATSKGVPWFVMPRADRKLVHDANDGRDWTIEIFRGILAGVAHAHERGVLHRDIKPSNILLFGRTPKVSDFGIAKQVDIDGTTLTRTAQELGTLRYMAPEQLANVKTAGPPADVYSLGKILGYLLTGRKPEPMKVDLTGVPDESRFFIDKCCRDDPAHRYADAGAALAAFEVTLRPSDIELPILDRAQELADAAVVAVGADQEAAAIEELDSHLRGHPDHEEAYQRVLPRVARPVLARWMKTRPETFRLVLTEYDRHVSGDLNFSYCDVIADFYAFVFKASDDISMKRMMLARLLEMGWRHNRFRVSDVVVGMLVELKGASDIALAGEVIDNHQEAAAWYANPALVRPLARPIATALRSAQALHSE